MRSQSCQLWYATVSKQQVLYLLLTWKFYMSGLSRCISPLPLFCQSLSFIFYCPRVFRDRCPHYVEFQIAKLTRLNLIAVESRARCF